MNNTEITEVLDEIVELGYVSFRDGVLIDSISPQKNIWMENLERWSSTLQYLKDYATYHPDFGGEFFVCLYDGWREYSEPAFGLERQYVPWKYVKHSDYLSKGSCGEPRFRHQADNIWIYPELPCKVLTYNRHIDDRNALLIPDGEFLTHQGFSKYTDMVDQCDIPWERKRQHIVWRGSPNFAEGYDWCNHGFPKMHPRQIAVNMSQSPIYKPILDASFVSTKIDWQLKYKYSLVLDGMANPWSSMYWKLWSNSLVIHLKSHWEQWYYHMLKPHEHLLSVPTLYDLPRTFKWAQYNDAMCKQIAQNGTQFVKRLTYEYAVQEYVIR